MAEQVFAKLCFLQTIDLLWGKDKLYYYRSTQPNATLHYCYIIWFVPMLPSNSFQKTMWEPSSSAATCLKAVLCMGSNGSKLQRYPCCGEWADLLGVFSCSLKSVTRNLKKIFLQITFKSLENCSNEEQVRYKAITQLLSSINKILMFLGKLRKHVT